MEALKISLLLFAALAMLVGLIFITIQENQSETIRQNHVSDCCQEFQPHWTWEECQRYQAICNALERGDPVPDYDIAWYREIIQTPPENNDKTINEWTIIKSELKTTKSNVVERT